MYTNDISPEGEPLGGYRLTDWDGSPDISYQLTHPYSFSAYRIEDGRIAIDDAVWGRCDIGQAPGDEVLLDLVSHPAVARLQAIEQLTLPKPMATIPGTTEFSRWEHVWGSVVLTRKLGERAGINPEELRTLELRALLSDVGQWAFSHLGDWIFQGMGGPEDAHDVRQAEFLAKVGIKDLIEEHGYDLDSLLVQGQVDDWVECASPDLCVDRIDFGAREVLRWLTGEPDLIRLKDNSNHAMPFAVEDGRVVMESKGIAKLFTKAYMLLSTEHWQEPVHRLQLQLLQEMVKYAIVHDDTTMMSWPEYGQYHPADMLMSVDNDFKASMHMVDSHQWLFYDIASEIGRSRRQIFRMVRADELFSFLRDDGAEKMPDPVQGTNWRSRHHPLSPSSVEIIPVETVEELADFGENPYALDFDLPPLKPRWIDPLYKDSRGRTKRLSEEDGSVQALHEHQKQLMQRRYVGRILLNPQYRALLKQALEDNNDGWTEAQSRPHMPEDTFRRNFESSAGLGIAYRLTHVDWQR